MAERRYNLVLVAAIITAFVATFAVYRYLQQAKRSSQVLLQSVVIAARDMSEGEKLERLRFPSLRGPRAPRQRAHSRTSTRRSDGSRGLPCSRASRSCRVDWRLPAVGPGLEVKIAPGKRAMALKINDVAGLSGLIQPNSRVDVLVTLQANQQQNTKEQAKLFMSNMRVLSVGTQVERGDDGKPIQATTATLEVTPQQAEQLAVAVNQGTIQLVLARLRRSGFGDDTGATSTDVLALLRSRPVRFGAGSEAGATPNSRATSGQCRAGAVRRRQRSSRIRKPDSVVVRVYRGDKLSQQKFEQKDST